MTAFLQQLQAVIHTVPTISATTWFATIDAAQVNHDLGINWHELSEMHKCFNLLDGTVEGTELELTCWLISMSEAMLEFTAELSQNSPFSCTWLQSAWSIEDIAAHWQHATNTRLPNGHNGLLRFYDPCVLQSLQAVLSSTQWQTLSAPTVRWMYIDRNGFLTSIDAQNQPVRKNGTLTLSQDQLKQLNEAGQTDRIILNMQANEHLPTTYDPFATYQRINAALSLLKKHNITKPQDQYLFSALTLDWPLTHFVSPALDHSLTQVKQEGHDLIQIIEQNSPTIS